MEDEKPDRHKRSLRRYNTFLVKRRPRREIANRIFKDAIYEEMNQWHYRPHGKYYWRFENPDYPQRGLLHNEGKHYYRKDDDCYDFEYSYPFRRELDRMEQEFREWITE